MTQPRATLENLLDFCGLTEKPDDPWMDTEEKRRKIDEELIAASKEDLRKCDEAIRASWIEAASYVLD